MGGLVGATKGASSVMLVPGNFEINRRLRLGLQLCGDGRQGANDIAGMLKLNVNPMQRR
jgi:hypothetical protein